MELRHPKIVGGSTDTRHEEEGANLVSQPGPIQTDIIHLK